MIQVHNFEGQIPSNIYIEIYLIILNHVITSQFDKTRVELYWLYKNILDFNETKPDSIYYIRAEMVANKLTKLRMLVNSNKYIRNKYHDQYLELEQQHIGRYYCPNCGNINIGRMTIAHETKPLELQDICRYDKIREPTDEVLIEMIYYRSDFNIRQYTAARGISIINYHELKEDLITRELIIEKTIEDKRELLKSLNNSYHATQWINNKRIYRIKEVRTRIGISEVTYY